MRTMKPFQSLLYFLFFFPLQLICSQHCATTFSADVERINLADKKTLPIKGSEKTTGIEIQLIIHQVLPQEVPFFTFEAIADQLETLNENFQKKDVSIHSLPEGLRELAAVSTIHFSLATTLENGESTIGTINIRTEIPTIGRIEELLISTTDGSPPVNPISYLNVYICEISENILGYASTPDLAGQTNDIVVIDYRRFGINSTYNSSGKTLTHEIGHYLGLSHPWGQLANECDEDDGITDTPFQRGPIYSCEIFMDCDNQLVGSNFMDYSPDCCLLYFTPGQIEVMNWVLTGVRSELGKNYKPQSVDFIDFSLFLYPNPARNLLRVKFGTTKPTEISIYDSKGSLLLKNIITSDESQSYFCLENLTTGTYIISATKDSLRKVKRFIHIS